MKIPTSQPESAPFRAFFLLQIAPPYRDTLERMGQLLAVFARGLEPDAVPDLPAGMPVPDLDQPAEIAPDVPAEMAAVLADLRHSAAALTWIGQHLTASELLPADLPLAEAAARAAEWLKRLIEELDGAGEPGRAQPISAGRPDRFSFETVRAHVGFSIPLPLHLAQQVGWKAGREVEWTLTAAGLALHPVEAGNETDSES